MTDENLAYRYWPQYFSQPSEPHKFTVDEATRILIARIERVPTAKKWWIEADEDKFNSIPEEIKNWLRAKYYLSEEEIDAVLYLTWVYFQQPREQLPPPEMA